MRSLLVFACILLCVSTEISAQEMKYDEAVSDSSPPYSVIYRKCLKKQLDTCKKITVIRHTRNFLEFETLDEKRGDYTWVWKKSTRDNYVLYAVKRNQDGRIVSGSGIAYKKPEYLEGRIDWQQPCRGEAYIRIGKDCPNIEEARNIQAPPGQDSEYRNLMQRNSK